MKRKAPTRDGNRRWAKKELKKCLILLYQGVTGLSTQTVRLSERPLNLEEREFAAEHHRLVERYMEIRGLDKSEWYDTVIFGYLLAVRKWLARTDLHTYQFSTIAFRAMDNKVSKERQVSAKLPLLCLDEPASGSEYGCTLLDVITEENLRYVPYGEARVRPSRSRSEEFTELGHFVADHPKGKCLCFEYDTQDEARQKAKALRDFRCDKQFHEVFNLTLRGRKIYVTLGERKWRLIAS